MGRTYKQEKEWGRKPHVQIKHIKKKKNKYKPSSSSSRTEDDSEYDDLEMEAIDEEFIERFRKKGN
jgi:hypothetical protein